MCIRDSVSDRIALLHEDIKHFDYQGYIKKNYQDSIADIDYLSDDAKEDKQARIHSVLCLHWFMPVSYTHLSFSLICC